jgi:hypothetical protein
VHRTSFAAIEEECSRLAGMTGVVRLGGLPRRVLSTKSCWLSNRASFNVTVTYEAIPFHVRFLYGV